MRSATAVTGKVATLPHDSSQTERVLPAEFLKKVERLEHGDILFFPQEKELNVDSKRLFVLNDRQLDGAAVLVARSNFGCGRNKEFAAWALREAGFQAVIAPSFAVRFQEYCSHSGLLLVEAEEEVVETMNSRATNCENYQITVDLDAKTITDAEGLSSRIKVSTSTRKANSVARA